MVLWLQILNMRISLLVSGQMITKHFKMVISKRKCRNQDESPTQHHTFFEMGKRNKQASSSNTGDGGRTRESDTKESSLNQFEFLNNHRQVVPNQQADSPESIWHWTGIKICSGGNLYTGTSTNWRLRTRGFHEKKGCRRPRPRNVCIWTRWVREVW